MRTMRTTVLTAATLLAAAATADAQTGRISEGQPYPTLSFPTVAGDGPMSAVDLRGCKTLLISFASW